MAREIANGAILAPGNAASAPLTFRPGANLTAPAAGAVEYDGRVFYTTPSSSAGRGVSPSMLLYRLNSALAGANVSTPQSVLGVGVSLAAGTVYAFEGVFTFSKLAGSTAHDFGISFGGTATLNNFYAQVLFSDLTGAAPATNWALDGVGFLLSTSSAANLVGVTQIATPSVTISVRVKGTVSIGAGGTFIPQYQLSAAPGGAYTTVTGSYFWLTPIGAAGGNTSVGAWA